MPTRSGSTLAGGALDRFDVRSVFGTIAPDRLRTVIAEERGP